MQIKKQGAVVDILIDLSQFCLRVSIWLCIIIMNAHYMVVYASDLTCCDSMTAGMVSVRVRGDRMPQTIAIHSDNPAK